MKRMMDISVASILLLTSPLLLLASIAIRIGFEGLFFIVRNGWVYMANVSWCISFTDAYRLKKMVLSGQRKWILVLRELFLRKARIDELPQLLCIVKW